MNIHPPPLVELRMRTAAALFAFLALSAGPSAADTEHVTRTFPAGPGAELRLNTFSGHVRVTGTDTPQIVIDATRTGSRSQLDAIKLDIEQHGSSIVIEANRRDRSWFTWWGHSDVVDTDFDIKVPRRTPVTVHSFSSAVEVSAAGDLEVHTFSAPVRLDGPSGRTTVHTFSGAITVTSGDPGSADSINIETFSGNVDLKFPANAHAIAEFHSFSGRLTCQQPLVLHSSSRRETTAELEGAGPPAHVRVKTFSSNLQIDR